MQKAGASPPDAADTARALADMDAYGVHSHGTKNLYDYIRKIQCGAMSATAQPVAVREGGSYALLDAQNGVGMLAATKAVQLAVQKAKDTGVGLVSVKNSCHFGAAGYYANLAALEGMLCVCISNVDANMTIPGAKGMVIGNNPFSWAVPAGRCKTVFFDIALSSVASLKVVQARREGKDVPAGWIVDGDGLPTTDPSRYPEQGAMLPMAGHKGYGFAMMVDCFTGALNGGCVSAEIPSWVFQLELPNDACHTIQVVDPEVFAGREAFIRRMEQLVDGIHAQPRAPGVARLLVPGELEWERRDRALREGLLLPEGTWRPLDKMAEALQLDIPWKQDALLGGAV